MTVIFVQHWLKKLFLWKKIEPKVVVLCLWTLQLYSVIDFSMIALQHYNKLRQMEPVILVFITGCLYHLRILSCLFCSLAPVPETASWQLFAKRKCLRMRRMMKIWMKTLSTVVNQVCSLPKCELCSFSQGVWVVLWLKGRGGKRFWFSSSNIGKGIFDPGFSFSFEWNIWIYRAFFHICIYYLTFPNLTFRAFSVTWSLVTASGPVTAQS